MVFFDLGRFYRGRSGLGQVIISFCFGLLLAPYGRGLFLIAITQLINEILNYVFSDDYIHQTLVRAGVISAAFSGWIIGRWLAGMEVLVDGVPEVY